MRISKNSSEWTPEARKSDLERAVEIANIYKDKYEKLFHSFQDCYEKYMKISAQYLEYLERENEKSKLRNAP